MPKPLAEHPGSGMHLHISLFQGERNAFHDPDPEEPLSPTGRAFLAGVLAHACELTAVTNQWINSYRRLATGFEAPDYVSWTRRGAAALVRVPSRRPGRAEGTRFELRSPDPACNPYMVLALVLAAGLRGIERGYELQAESIDDDPGGAARLPLDLREATDLFDASELARETLGDRLVDVVRRQQAPRARRRAPHRHRVRPRPLPEAAVMRCHGHPVDQPCERRLDLRRAGSETTSRLLAELGFSPHRVAANGTLRPPDGESRAPALALVLATGSSSPPAPRSARAWPPTRSSPRCR